MAQFLLDIMTPERAFFSGQAEGVVVNTPDGELCVLAGHVPMVTALGIGTMRMRVNGQWQEAFVSEGFMEVGLQRTVIFSQSCEWAQNIDVPRTQAALQRAQENARQMASIREHKINQIAMARAMARLRITRSHLK